MFHTTTLFPAKTTPIQLEDAESAAKPQRLKPTYYNDDDDNQVANKRLKDVEISVPVVYGTMAFYLGRKANELQSHKWTVYLRGATNEDLSVVIKQVVFQLHPSFDNPIRVVESPPFELSECGWGEFEIGISILFHDDVCDKHVDMFHLLKLYPDAESGPQSTKKPVVVETYNEIVFPDPLENFLARVLNHPAVCVPRLPAGFNLPPSVPCPNMNVRGKGDTKNHPLNHWFVNFSEADELLKLASARQQVQAHILKLRRQLSVLDGPPQPSKLAYEKGCLSRRSNTFCELIMPRDQSISGRGGSISSGRDIGHLYLSIQHKFLVWGNVEENKRDAEEADRASLASLRTRG
ncbi:unnamed protein product [Dovyalis caffra]|uniref:YEATS domain-containing protein n=1 Tax=Dovyalis caffra TaxID=77055 RepID=A0AAV1RER7_9ROSI|nr:unnamed protein product [Dovyalis caffra]